MYCITRRTLFNINLTIPDRDKSVFEMKIFNPIIKIYQNTINSKERIWILIHTRPRNASDSATNMLCRQPHNVYLA